jgi:cation transport protein ChaC
MTVVDGVDAVEDFWIFGYGSLIFKPPPFYDLRVPGYIKGYVRRFWQSSNDHRGTPEAPGRVVTLIERQFWSTLDDPHPSPHNDITWGVAYRIRADKVEYVKQYLDYREKNGYSVSNVPFVVSRVGVVDGEGNSLDSDILKSLPSIINCGVYIGTPENEAFVGPEEPDKLAAHILRSRGPSGDNREYLFKLGEALKEVAPESFDHHIEDLIARALKLEALYLG